MKVKIGDIIFDSTTEPILIILSDDDKSNISQMHPSNRKYCSYPNNGLWIKEDIEEFMKVE